MLSPFPFLQSRSVIPDCFLIFIPNRSVGSGGFYLLTSLLYFPCHCQNSDVHHFLAFMIASLNCFFPPGKPFSSLPPETSSRCSSYSVFPLLETCRGGSLQLWYLNFLAWNASPSHLDFSVLQLYLPYLTLNYVSHPPAVPICFSLNKSGIFNISRLLDLPSHGLKGSFCLWGSFSHLGRIISLRKPLNSSVDLKVSFSIAVLPGTCFHYWIWCIIL